MLWGEAKEHTHAKGEAPLGTLNHTQGPPLRLRLTEEQEMGCSQGGSEEEEGAGQVLGFVWGSWACGVPKSHSC